MVSTEKRTDSRRAGVRIDRASDATDPESRIEEARAAVRDNAAVWREMAASPSFTANGAG